MLANLHHDLAKNNNFHHLLAFFYTNWYNDALSAFFAKHKCGSPAAKAEGARGRNLHWKPERGAK